MTVDMKSKAESTREARTDREDEVSATMNFAARRKTLAAKLMRIAMFTTRELDSNWFTEVGRSADSSSKETRLDDGAENSDGRR